jgi:hypothetical protein
MSWDLTHGRLSSGDNDHLEYSAYHRQSYEAGKGFSSGIASGHIKSEKKC